MQHYLQPKLARSWTLILYVFVLVIAFFLESIGVMSTLKSFYAASTSPISSVSAHAAYWFNNKTQQFVDMWQAQDSLLLLRKENAVLQAQIALLETVQKENEALLSLFGEDGTALTKEDAKVATVVGYSIPTISSQNTQLHFGELVMAQGTLIGMISEVFGNQARLELLSSTKIHPIHVKTESGVEGIIVGTSRRVTMTDIPTDRTLRPGEKVITVGQVGIPPSVYIGTIGEKVEQSSASVQTFTITQPVSFFETTLVEIK